jgi:hypothetical protein
LPPVRRARAEQVIEIGERPPAEACLLERSLAAGDRGASLISGESAANERSPEMLLATADRYLNQCDHTDEKRAAVVPLRRQLICGENVGNDHSRRGLADADRDVPDGLDGC